jgi:transporter family protein
MRAMLQPWMVFAFGSALFAALTAVFAKVGVSGLGSDLAAFVRTAVILVVTAAIVTVRGEWRKPDALPALPLAFLVLSAVATALSWLCYLKALETGPTSGVVSIDKLSLVLVVVLAAAFLGERPSWSVVLGAGLVAVGALLVSLPG